ncbi:MAG: GspH/FimT family pseudopilin [Pseudomonadota bacterium]
MCAPSARLGAGFTLVELLLVVMIAGLALAVVPPLLTASLPGAQVRTAAQQLASGLRSARGQAIARGEESLLQLDLERNSYRQGGREVALAAGLELVLDTASSEVLGAGAGGIRFFPDGSSTGGRIEVRGGGRAYRLDVDWLTGRVTVHETD